MKKKLLQLHSYKRKEYEELEIPKKSNEIIRIPNDKVDVEVLAKNLILRRIEHDETNKIGFYEIVPDKFDLFPKSKKTPYKSIHNPNESHLVALNKFHSKKHYNYLERKMRDELRSKPGNKLLLNEMYFYTNIPFFLIKILIVMDISMSFPISFYRKRRKWRRISKGSTTINPRPSYKW